MFYIGADANDGSYLRYFDSLTSWMSYKRAEADTVSQSHDFPADDLRFLPHVYFLVSCFRCARPGQVAILRSEAERFSFRERTALETFLTRIADRWRKSAFWQRATLFMFSALHAARIHHYTLTLARNSLPDQGLRFKLVVDFDLSACRIFDHRTLRG